MKVVRKRKWDKIVVAIGLTAGFSLIIMKVTAYWPCDIINMLSGKYLC
jgi:hypothetical protein